MAVMVGSGKNKSCHIDELITQQTLKRKKKKRPSTRLSCCPNVLHESKREYDRRGLFLQTSLQQESNKHTLLQPLLKQETETNGRPFQLTHRGVQRTGKVRDICINPVVKSTVRVSLCSRWGGGLFYGSLLPNALWTPATFPLCRNTVFLWRLPKQTRGANSYIAVWGRSGWLADLRQSWVMMHTKLFTQIQHRSVNMRCHSKCSYSMIPWRKHLPLQTDKQWRNMFSVFTVCAQSFCFLSLVLLTVMH